MKRVTAHVAAAFVLVSVAFVLSTAGALAKENPGNHYGKYNNPGNHYGQISNPGHHYGQLKHTPPPPVSTPAPVPAQHPVANPPAVGATVVVQITGSTPGLSDGGTSSLPNLPVTLPPQEQTSGQAAAVDGVPAGGLGWLILLVLPSLLAVWVIAFARIALTAARRRRAARAAALVGAPGLT